jgi:single-strand DNA-binding protein
MNGIVTAFEGKLGGDAELRFTSTGKALLNFSVGVLENRSGGDGAELQWIKCVAWEDDAERLAPVLKKGIECYVEGRLRLNTWTNADGETKAGLNVSCWVVQPMGQIGRKAPRRPDSAMVGSAS